MSDEVGTVGYEADRADRAEARVAELEAAGTAQPGVIWDEENWLTELTMRDTLIVWCPLDHTCPVDIGYDENGILVGVKIFADVIHRPIEEETHDD